MTAQSKKADWPRLYREGWSGPEVRPRDPEAAFAKAGAPARSCVCLWSLDRRLPGSPVVGGQGSAVPFVDPAVQGREGQDREEPSSSSDTSPCP